MGRLFHATSCSEAGEHSEEPAAQPQADEDAAAAAAADARARDDAQAAAGHATRFMALSSCCTASFHVSGCFSRAGAREGAS